MAYVNDFTPGVMRAIGAVLPTLTGILSWLAPAAAFGLAVSMGGAMATHSRRKEYPMIIVNLILLALAGFVAYWCLVAVSQ